MAERAPFEVAARRLRQEAENASLRIGQLGAQVPGGASGRLPGELQRLTGEALAGAAGGRTHRSLQERLCCSELLSVGI